MDKTNINMRDNLAVDRTVLANERTILAYIRTSLTLVVVGLSILKFFDSTSIGLQILAWVLIISGLVFLVYGYIRYRTEDKLIGRILDKDGELGR